MPDEHLGGDIDIDLDVAGTPVRGRPASPYILVIVALVVGFLIGVGTTNAVRRANPPAPLPVSMHTVVVTEDGRSESYTMPTGSVVSTPAVRNSCAITVDGKFVDVLNRVLGNAECAATVR